MEYQKITFLHNNTNKSSKFRRKNWVEINDGHMEDMKPVVKLDFKLQC